ncbi:MAG: PKD domain-containing protein [Bacteroidota bacterium]
MKKITLLFLLFLTCSFLFHAKLSAQCNADDWQVLQAVYTSTNGDNWTNNTNWDLVDSATPPASCDLGSMHGITLDGSGRVVGINLSGNNLSGPLPAELGTLTSLTSLDLSNNALTGTLPPNFADLSGLTQFNVSNNALSGCYDEGLAASSNSAEELAAGGTTYSRPAASTLIINDFDPARDQVDLGAQSIHTQIVYDGETGLTFQNMFNRNSALILEGIFLKDLQAFNFLPIADAHLQQDLSAALAYENCTGLSRPNTVYVRSHQANLVEEVEFDPATDKISFFYLLVRGDEGVNFLAEQTWEGARFFSPFTGQSITLLGVDFSDLNSSHFEFRANQLEDNIVGRMDLDLYVPGFQVDNNNVFNGKSVAMAGGVDRAPYHIFNHSEYTGDPICTLNNSALCSFSNAEISAGNNFSQAWEDFCQSGVGNCNPPSVAIVTPASNTGFQIGTDVSVSATATDPDGSIASVVFSVDDIETPLTNTTGNTYTGSWSPATTGIFTLTVSATDNDGLVATTTTSTTIYLDNPPPTASFVATPDYGPPPLAVSFDASSSSDLNGDPLTYAWDFGDGTTSTGVTTSHLYPNEGVYTVTLTVDDGNGGSDSFSSPVTVVAPNCALEAHYKTPDASTSAATDNQIRAHFLLYNNGDNTINLEDITIRYWYTKEGNENQNAYIDYARVGSANVTTNFVSLSSPVDGADHYVEVGFTAGAGSIAANDNSGEVQVRIAKQNWSNYDETDDYSFNATYNSFTSWDRVTVYCNGLLTWGTEPDGTTDGGGNGPTNTPPTAVVTTSGTTGTAPFSVSFDGSGSSDADGDMLSYVWDFGDGNSATGSMPTHVYTTPGTYTATLTVDDGNGGSDTESIAITVESDDEEPGGAVEVVFNVNSFWGQGYCANIEIINNGTTAINGWNLSFTHDANINNLWNANWSNNNGNYTTSNVSWNAVIPAGGSRSFGYCASHNGSVSAPTNGMLNGSPVSITFNNSFRSSSIASALDNSFSVAAQATELSILPTVANQTTTLGYHVPQTESVQLSVLDPTGRLIKTIVNGVIPAGQHYIDYPTGQLAAGTYLVRLVTKEENVIKRLIVVH